ncbi:hypothetical protein [Labrenzia sp. DG1229]|uniref:hypothetical protein n=1 Tax=Labrenzia sp. DG1229 TaxID=681847 RepID=UPI000AC1EF54|nr:hypothetical protein [Labrenzia sp. DG1229]
MPDRSWVVWGILGLVVLTAIYCLWILTADAYLRLFLDLAVTRFICLAGLPQVQAVF